MRKAGFYTLVAALVLGIAGCDTTGGAPAATSEAQITGEATQPVEDGGGNGTATGRETPAGTTAAIVTPVETKLTGRTPPPAEPTAGGAGYPMLETPQPGQQPQQEDPASRATPATGGSALEEAEAVALITAFAEQHLGTSVAVTGVGGPHSAVVLPRQYQNQLASLASRAGGSAGALSDFGGDWGGAAIFVGYGGRSNDSAVDISSSSLGAFSVSAWDATPADAAAAIEVIRRYFPALGELAFEQQPADNGFSFIATRTIDGVDPQNGQATAVEQRILAGVTFQGDVTVAWVMVGIGPFAGELQP